MNITRIVAVLREGGTSKPEYQLFIVCGLNEDDHVAPGEWMGYTKNGSIIHPFVVNSIRDDFSDLRYGGEENYIERTNFGNLKIEVGNYFTVQSPIGALEEWQSIYEIRSIHKYLNS